MIQITDEITWDETKKYYDQSEAATDFLNEILQTKPLIEETEDCSNGYNRPISRTWKFGKAILKQVNTYMESATSPRWGALADSTYIVSKD